MKIELFRKLLNWALLALFCWAVCETLIPFLSALIWAAVLALFFWPAHLKVIQKIENRNLACFLSTALIGMLLIAPGVVVTHLLVQQTMAVAGDANTLLTRVQKQVERVQSYIPWKKLQNARLDQTITQAGTAITAKLGEGSAKLASALVAVLFELSVAIFALFYCLRDGPQLVDDIMQFLHWSGATGQSVLGEIYHAVHATVSSILMVALIQGTAGGFVFWVMGISAPVLWGLATGLSSLLPVVGTALVWVPHAIWLFAAGEVWRGGLMVVLGTCVISGVDNLLRPVLITTQSHLNLLLVFMGVVGGAAAFGAVGLILGPVLLSVAHALFQRFKSSL